MVRSDSYRKHGRTQKDKQKYLCKSCGRTFRENSGTNAYNEEILRASHERTSLRGLIWIFFEGDDYLELDELWSFVSRCRNKRWVWLAQCRRTHQPTPRVRALGFER